MIPTSTLSLIFGITLFIIFILIALVSQREREKRATKVSLFLALILALPFILLGIIPIDINPVVVYIPFGLICFIILLLILPIRGKTIQDVEIPSNRFDERDTMFSRRLLEPGSSRFETYYRENPGKKSLDDRFRDNPGLLARGSSLFNVYTFASAHASFDTVRSFWPIIDGVPDNKKENPDPGKITQFIKNWTRKLGAVSVGITELKEYHLYSNLGRQEPYGAEIKKEHKYAIAITVEMDKSMLDHAPYGPAVMESSQQYLTSGAIATQIAIFIRRLGYAARAHIDGNYRVICPLVARDAGLGEIGRMGLLMIPELGPRVRIAVVTTDLPLEIDQRKYNFTMIDFCRQCKKCADVCPSNAIPFADRKMIDGARRWQIDSELCYTFWTSIGTDCARCVSVCPYSHPNNLLHNLIRKGVYNSTIFRKVAIKMDDLFYGRKPVPLKPADWLDM